MFTDLSKELVAQNEDVPPVACRMRSRRVAVEPDVGLAREMESGSGEEFGTFRRSLAAKEDRGTKDPLDAGHEAAIRLATLLHAEHLQHLCSGSESKRLALLADSEGRKEDQNQAILAERETKVGVTQQLKLELAITTFE